MRPMVFELCVMKKEEEEEVQNKREEERRITKLRFSSLLFLVFV